MKYHKSPDGIYRRCSNPANCKFKTPQDEHIDKTVADARNEKTWSRGSENGGTLQAKPRRTNTGIPSDMVPEGFDPHTASPQDFDDVLADIYSKRNEWQDKCNAILQTADNSYRHVLDPNHKGRNMRPQQVLESLVLKQGKERWDNQHLEQLSEMANEYSEQANKYLSVERKLDKIHQQRGGWSRAYLAITSSGGGHVHKTTNCSTCNKNHKATRFSWQTSYSGASEETIVQDAGYRACTVCYPNAPVGDEKTLPTKMFSEEEKKRAEEASKREQARGQKKLDAIAKAATKNGEPLKADGVVFKTETVARNYITQSTLDSLDFEQEKEPKKQLNDWFIKKHAKDRANNRLIIRSLAEKHDVTIGEIVDSVNPAIEKKVKQYNKSISKPDPIILMNYNEDSTDPNSQYYIPPLEYTKQTFGFTEEELNSKP